MDLTLIFRIIHIYYINYIYYIYYIYFIYNIYYIYYVYMNFDSRFISECWGGRYSEEDEEAEREKDGQTEGDRAWQAHVLLSAGPHGAHQPAIRGQPYFFLQFGGKIFHSSCLPNHAYYVRGGDVLKTWFSPHFSILRLKVFLTKYCHWYLFEALPVNLKRVCLLISLIFVQSM